MTVEAFTPAPPLTVAGIGPYAVPHPYTTGSLSVVIESAGQRTTLAPADWTADPVTSTTAGSVYLTPAAAALWAGATLYTLRDTQAEQGWQGVQGEREKGLELQLDRMTMLAQEAQAGLASALRVGAAIPVIVPGLDRTLLWTGSAFIPGPTADQIEAAAEAALDTLAVFSEFERRYLGPKAADPATDNAGGVLATGALYWNTTLGEMRTWSGSAWAVAYVPLAGLVPATRTVATGTGLAGGGSLAADRTLELTGQALRLHELAVNGLVTRVGATTITARSIAGTANQIAVADAAGIAANPTLSLVLPSQAEAEAGTDANKPMTALRARQAIDRVSFGRGQLQVDVTASRAVNTIYQNLTGRPIFVSVVTVAGSSTSDLLIGSTIPNLGVFSRQESSTSHIRNVLAMVPDQFYYQYIGASFQFWREMR